jgi:sarcosine oxidase
MATADVIVLGLGAMGSAAAYHLARRRVRVIGLEQYTPAHSLGSSHGHSRIIREAYFEHPDYVPLIQRAYEQWRALQEECDTSLLIMTGGLMIGPRDGVLVQGALASARAHHLPHELISADEIQRRFPPFRVPAEMVAVQEPNAGVLHPEACIRAHLDGATAAGAMLHYEEPVLRWTADGHAVEVVTAQQRYSAARLVITAGPWAPQVLEALNLPLQVERNVMHWFTPRSDASAFAPSRFPIYICEYRSGAFFYGFPAQSDGTVKVAHHHSGEFCSPSTLRREVTPAEVTRIRGLLEAHLPTASGELKATAVCMYTNTPDFHFIIDRHPQHPQVTLACGFSGHGFKFSSVVGEVLADLAVDGWTRHPIALFRLPRFR